MSDVFNLKSEISAKENLVSKFSKWWSDKEIRERVIPSIVDGSLRDLISGALKNDFDSEDQEKKSFAEILYDLVGQNFLVNDNKFIRNNFLLLILRKKDKNDPSFQDRFFSYLSSNRKSTISGSCKSCNMKWSEDQIIYYQTLGLEKEIICFNYQCFCEQQYKQIPKISNSNFNDFIQKFKLGRTYFNFCKQLVEEFDFPIEVILRPNREIKLLPEIIRPIGNFPPLHDYQTNIGTKIIDMLENYEIDTSRALVVLPTGAGKTRLVVETLVEWINNGKKGKENSKFILWIVDRKELCQQAFDTFADIFRHKGRKDSSLKLHPIYGEHAKNIRDILYQYSDHEPEEFGEIHEENGVIIASIQSLYKISQNEDRGSLPDLGEHTSIVIIDEAHHAIPSNKSYTSVLHALGFEFKNVSKKGVDINKNHTCLLGLTATPFRGDDQLGKSTRDLLNRFGKKHRILWPAFTDFDEKENIAPHAHLDVQKTAFQNERVKLYGEGSYDRDGRINEYHFTITFIENNLVHNSKRIIHTEKSDKKNIDFIFKYAGTYMIQLTVKDDDGKSSENQSCKTIKVLSTEKRVEKTNIDEMKKLYKSLIKREILSKPHHYIIDYSKRVITIDKESEIEQFNKFHDISNLTIRSIGNDSSRNQRIIDKLISLVKKEGRQSILLFACSVEHAKLISFILDAIHGIKSASIDHKMSAEDRDEIVHDFRLGKISVLCNYDILSTGFDSPKVECVFIARPTFSRLLYNQMTGRGLRGPRSNGTSDCIIVDISDNIQIVSNKEVIEQPWEIFKYIYETTFDESKENEQQCYGCFGVKNDKIQNCNICSGAGTITRASQSTPTPKPKKDKKELQKLQIQEYIKRPDLDYKQINKRVKNRTKYDEILDSRKIQPDASNKWAKICKTCNVKSYNMTKTLYLFGRSPDLISENNPNGIFDECKKCRNKQM